MSGRKQHYIPQFFLRGFAESGKAKKAQVRVVTRERNFIASTEGVAAQRDADHPRRQHLPGHDHRDARAAGEAFAERHVRAP